MKIKLVFVILLLILANIHANPNAEGEMWIRVSDYNDYIRGGVTITVYNSLWQIVDIATTANYTVEQSGNAFMYMDDEPISNPSASYVIGPLKYGGTYYFVIDNKYAEIQIDSNTSTPDEHLRFRGSTFYLDPEHKIMTLESQGDWNEKIITAKNSFNDGKIKIDNELFTNIGSSGVTKSFGEPTFPHSLTAYDNQTSGDYVRKYQNWTGSNGLNTSNIVTPIQAEAATYTANFLKQFNITFKNSFVNVGNGGNIKVEGSTVSSPTGIYNITQYDQQGISFEAVNQTINGIYYTFSHWDDNSTSKSRTLTPPDHHNYVATFIGKPVGVGNSVTFNSGDPVGTPVKLNWIDNQNPNVKYKIYRKHGKNGTISQIATVNSGVQKYTDYEMSITNNTSTDNLTWYDVRAYYTTEGTSADDNFKTIYADNLAKQNNSKKDSIYVSAETITENSITCFPNPFNPTTTIYYKLKEKGQVVIKVYDMLGKEVAILENTIKPMGEYVAKFDGSRLSSGMYILRMQLNNYSQSHKILLAK